VEHLLQDLKYSLRMFSQQRAFTFAAVAALALGIGATTAVFTVVDTVVLRPFPFPDPDRIVLFESTSPGGQSVTASPTKFNEWKAQSDVVEQPAAFRSGIVNYTSGETPEQISSGQVSANYFPLFGATTVIGRTFTPDEDRPGGPQLAVLSYGWWSRRFGKDPAILGKTIALSGVPYVVIGVTSPKFDPSDLGDSPDAWTPFQLDPNSIDQGHFFTSAGRLRPGVTLAQAKAKFAQAANDFRHKYPDAIDKNESFSVERIADVYLRNARTLLGVLLAAVAGVLLIACANVANLLLVRSSVRKREMVIRAAIGAGRGRIIAQLMTESVLLAIIGGAVGLALGLSGIRWLLAINTAGLSRLGENGSFVHLDWRVLAFATLVSIATGLIFGVVPALHIAREDLNIVLREGSGAVGGGRRNGMRSALVVLEIALAVALVIGSSLLIRTSLALNAVAPGFDATNVLTMRMAFTGTRYDDPTAVAQAIRDGTERLRALPGVESASAGCCLPLEGGFGLPFQIIGRPLDKSPYHGGGAWITASPGYFEVFKIRVLQGRSLTDQDTKGTTPVVMINEAMAKKYWKTGTPIGAHLLIGHGVTRELADEPEREIIGVVADSHDQGLNADPQPKMIVPLAQMPPAFNAFILRLSPIAWVVRTHVPPMSLSKAIQDQLKQATGLPVSSIRTMDEVISRSTSRTRFNTLLMTVFAISALVLAAIGIYGVMAYAVQQRTREIGVRLALGAEPGAVRTMVVLQGMRLAVIGAVIGVGAAVVLSRYMSSLLFGVQPRDPVVFAGVPLLLAAVALVAVWIPAVRASRVDPLGALRAT
jgi:putative ABC transport system permease protein